MSFLYDHPSSELTLVPAGPGGLLAAWRADGITDMSVEFPGAVTEHPVADGDPLTDTIILLPPVVTVTGVLTDSPSGFLGGLGSGPDRAIKLANDLLALRNARTVVSARTSRGTFPGYVIESNTETRDASTGRGIVFTLVLRRRRVARTTLVPSEVDADALALGAGGEQQVSI